MLKAVCQKYQASLALPSGEVSDSMLYGIMRDAFDDGRPLVIHQLGDFDPAGNQMAVSTGRTIQALRDSLFPTMRVIVNAIGLTLGQCEAWGLPSTPLKETEQRADKWIRLMGREQTELDAAVALVPDEFAGMVGDALGEYYDSDLVYRAREARGQLIKDANGWLSYQLDDARLAVMRGQVETRLGELQAEVDALNEALNIDLSGIEPPGELKPIMGDSSEGVEPLVDTREPWAISTQRMIRRKALEQQP